MACRGRERFAALVRGRDDSKGRRDARPRGCRRPSGSGRLGAGTGVQSPVRKVRYVGRRFSRSGKDRSNRGREAGDRAPRGSREGRGQHRLRDGRAHHAGREEPGRSDALDHRARVRRPGGGGREGRDRLRDRDDGGDVAHDPVRPVLPVPARPGEHLRQQADNGLFLRRGLKRLRPRPGRSRRGGQPVRRRRPAARTARAGRAALLLHQRAAKVPRGHG